MIWSSSDAKARKRLMCSTKPSTLSISSNLKKLSPMMKSKSSSNVSKHCRMKMVVSTRSLRSLTP